MASASQKSEAAATGANDTGLKLLQDLLAQIQKQNPPVSSVAPPTAADIQKQEAVSANTDKTTVAKQPSMLTSPQPVQPVIAPGMPVTQAIMNQGQLIPMSPQQDSSGSSAKGLSNIMDMFSDSGDKKSGGDSGGLGQMGSAIAGIAKLAALFL